MEIGYVVVCPVGLEAACAQEIEEKWGKRPVVSSAVMEPPHGAHVGVVLLWFQTDAPAADVARMRTAEEVGIWMTSVGGLGASGRDAVRDLCDACWGRDPVEEGWYRCDPSRGRLAPSFTARTLGDGAERLPRGNWPLSWYFTAHNVFEGAGGVGSIAYALQELLDGREEDEGEEGELVEEERGEGCDVVGDGVLSSASSSVCAWSVRERVDWRVDWRESYRKAMEAWFSLHPTVAERCSREESFIRHRGSGVRAKREQGFTQDAVAAAVAHGVTEGMCELRERGVHTLPLEWRADMEGFEAEFTGFVDGSRADVMLVISSKSWTFRRHRQDDARVEEAEKSTEASSSDSPVIQMRASLAACLVALADLREGEVVWDPMCGSGAIPAEVVLASRERGIRMGAVFGSDVDQRALRLAALNTSFLDRCDPSSAVDALAHPTSDRALIFEGDIESAPLLPAGSVDAIVTDAPYGHRCGIPQRFYASMWRAFAHALKPGGRVVLLGPLSADRLFHPLFHRSAFELLAVIPTHNANFPTSVLIARRRSDEEALLIPHNPRLLRPPPDIPHNARRVYDRANALLRGLTAPQRKRIRVALNRARKAD